MSDPIKNEQYKLICDLEAANHALKEGRDALRDLEAELAEACGRLEQLDRDNQRLRVVIASAIQSLGAALNMYEHTPLYGDSTIGQVQTQKPCVERPE